MSGYIKKMLRESLDRRSDNPANRRQFKNLHRLMEKKIKVGDNITKKLHGINTPLSQNLLNFINSDKIKDDVNVDFVDYDKKNEKLFTVGYQDQRGGQKERYMKFQKLLTYLGGSIENIKSYEVEELMNHLKKADTNNIKIVDGNDILWAYHCDNYDEGETMGSCMRHGAAQRYLEIYTQNPNQIKCIVLVNPENNKVRGRALLWKLNNGEMFVDRIYVTNTQYMVEFNNFIEEQGFQTGNPSDDVTLDNGGEFETYPYMDKLTWYTPDEGRLSRNDGDIELQDTNGGHSGMGEWSEYHEEFIPRDEACYVDHMNSYMWCDSVVRGYDDEYLYGDSEDVVMITTGEQVDQWALVNDTVELWDGYICHEDEAVSIDIGDHKGSYGLMEDMTVDVHGFDVLSSECIEISLGTNEGDYIHRSEALAVLDSNGELHGILHENGETEEYEDEYQLIPYDEYDR